MPEDYVIQQGDCLHSIAVSRGLLWQTIWDHPNNSELKALRKDPNILKEGDKLFIPDLEIRQESRGTDQKHVFTRKGVPAILKLRILDYENTRAGRSQPPPAPQGGRNITEDDPEPDRVQVEEVPRANVPYTLEIDGKLITGNTDEDGIVNEPIPPDARHGKLIIEPGTLNETVIPLQLGFLNPLSEISGIKHRLSNLGFNCGDQTDEITPEFEEALRQFQARYQLPVTGQPDEETKNKLKELHRS